MRQVNYKKAEETINTAMLIEPYDEVLLTNRVLIYAIQNKIEDAKKELKKVLLLNQNNDKANQFKSIFEMQGIII